MAMLVFCAASLVVINAPSAATRIEQFIEAKPIEILGPRLWSIEMTLKIILDAPLRVLPYLGGVEVEMLEQRLVEAIALVGCRPERDLDDGVDGEERDLGPVGLAADLIVRDDALGGQDHPVRRHGQ